MSAPDPESHPDIIELGDFAYVQPWKVIGYQTGSGFGRNLLVDGSPVENVVHMGFQLEGLKDLALFIASPEGALQIGQAIVDAAEHALSRRE